MKLVWVKFPFAYPLIGLMLGFGSPDASAASTAWDICKGPKPEQSIPACTDLLARQPEGDVPRAEILKQRARSYMKSYSKRGKAIPDLTEVIALAPGDVEAFAMRAEANDAVDNHLAALKDYDAALAIDPNYKKPDGSALSIRHSRNHVAAIIDPLWKQCTEPALLSPNETFNACTKIIERGEAESPVGRAEAYKRRAGADGVPSFRLAKIERALADLNEALRLIPNDVEALKERSARLVAMGRHDEAIADLDRAETLDPGNADILVARGQVYEDMGDQERADAQYKDLARIDPDNSWLKARASWKEAAKTAPIPQMPYSQISAMCLIPNEVADEQIAACTSALKVVPEGLPSRADLLRTRAAAYLIKGNHDATIADFDQAISIKAQDVMLLVMRGDAKAAAGRQAEADADYRAALRVDEPIDEPQGEIDMPLLRCIAATGTADQTIESCTAVLNRGDALPKARRITALTRRGGAYYAKMLEVAPVVPTQDRPANEQLAKDFGDRGKRDFQTIMDIDPTNQEIAGRIASLEKLPQIGKEGTVGNESWKCQTSREPDERIAVCSVNITNPEMATTSQRAEWHRSRASAYLEKNETDLASADIDAAERLEPNHKTISELRIKAYEKKGDYKRALEDFDQAAAFRPQDFSKYRRDELEDRADPPTGHCLRSHEVTDEKRIEACTALLARQPAAPPARRKEIFERRARAYSYKQPEKYIEDLTSALEIDPKDVRLLIARGRAFLDHRKDEQAFADFNKAAELEPYNTDVFMERGFAYSLRQDTAKAQADYEHVLKLDPESDRARGEIARLKANQVERAERKARQENPAMKTCTAPFHHAAPDDRIAACTMVR
jgi:tetratricopeptide (TPR) repeat protein